MKHIILAIVILVLASCNAHAGELNMGQRDKQIHAVGSFVGMQLLSHYTTPENAAVTILALGAAKEIADPYNHGNRDRRDFEADLIGVAAGYISVKYLTWEW